VGVIDTSDNSLQRRQQIGRGGDQAGVGLALWNAGVFFEAEQITALGTILLQQGGGRLIDGLPRPRCD